MTATTGGINGTMLARALSHDLPMGALRNLWVENADVAVLQVVHHQAVAVGAHVRQAMVVISPVNSAVLA